MELLPENAGGDAAAQARELVDAKADVVIGPTDSSRAPAAIDVLSKAKVALISPANTAAELSQYKSGGYYFRTAAADVAQAAVLVKLAKDGGAKSLAVVHEEAATARRCPRPSSASAKGAGLEPVTHVRLQAGRGAESGGCRCRGSRAGRRRRHCPRRCAGRHRRTQQRRAVREASSSSATVPSGSTARASVPRRWTAPAASSPGVFPSAHLQGELVAVDPGLKDMTFAAETYDAVNLAALAAAAADDDAGASIAANADRRLRRLGAGASAAQPAASPRVCKTYKECLAAVRAGTRR